MKLGYARVSTDDQSLEVQIEQLTAAGCAHIYREKESGRHASRSMLQIMLREIEEGGPGSLPHCVVVVTKLDRLARNTRDLLEIVDRLGKAGAGLVSLGEPWADTTSHAGRMVMTVLAGVAEFERARILERTSEGRAYAKRNGVHMGRPAALSKEQQRAAAQMLKGSSVGEVSRVFKISERTVRRMMKARP